MMGETEIKHLKTLDEIFSRLSGAGLKLKKEKRAFMLDSVEYLGHRISGEGLRKGVYTIHLVIRLISLRLLVLLQCGLCVCKY